MKRILLSIMLMAGMIFGVSILTTSPAQAAYNCGNVLTPSAHSYHGDYSVTRTLHYKKCNNLDGTDFNIVIKYRIDWVHYIETKPTSKRSHYDDALANPDALGTWDPPTKSEPAVGSMTMIWVAPDNLRVYENATSGKKCVAAVLRLTNAGVNYDTETANQCMSFVN